MVESWSVARFFVQSLQKLSRATKNIARSKSKFSSTALEVALSSSFEVLFVSEVESA